MEFLVIGVLAAIAIIAVTAIASRLGGSAPLVLVVLGVALSLLPFVAPVEIEPEWILAGVLPPLLYATSVSMPTMDFRRDFTAISGLSVVLVVISAVVLGFLFAWLVPGIGLATGIALGAVVSPTDAVATSIVRQLGVSPRLVTVLEGESLLNDASALVLLRSAIVATAGSVTLWKVFGDFVFAVLVAATIGVLVGWVSLRIRSRVTDASVNTAISFVVPFVAYFPAEHLGASGLVATVAAGLVAGAGSARHLRPADRMTEAANWRTLELLLEGAIFLVMGLELYGLVVDVEREGGGLWFALGLGALAAVVVVLVRAAYSAPLLWWLGRRSRRAVDARDYLAGVQRTLDDGKYPESHESRARHISRRITRRVADIDYLAAEPLGPREGVILVWAGMRGAVTLAAAQSFPRDTPQRSLLILIAFVVAAGTLLVQGGTLPWAVRKLDIARAPDAHDEERRRLVGSLGSAAAGVIDDPELRRRDGGHYSDEALRLARMAVGDDAEEIEEEGSDARLPLKQEIQELRLAVIAVQRNALLDARQLGTYSSVVLRDALTVLDADEMSTRLRSPGDD